MKQRSGLNYQAITKPYVGRFAPSPTGPLHMGSLVAALGSYLHAKQHKGLWLLRIEDLDTFRVVASTMEQIPSQLQQHGLHWDGDIIYQSQRLDLYAAYLEKLHKQRLTYFCDCNRQRLKALDYFYDGKCANSQMFEYKTDENLINAGDCHNAAIRIRLNGTQHWQDSLAGKQTFSVDDMRGDFIVRRRDMIFSYQLAVSIDDTCSGISHVIRGADLISSTAKQIYLQQALDLESPIYGHLPIVTDNNGLKLSKQFGAESLDLNQPSENLHQALTLLGQNPPTQLIKERVAVMIEWAQTHFDSGTIPKLSTSIGGG